LYEVHHERYAVYWKTITPAAWEQNQAASAAIEKQWTALQTAALDRVAAGDVSSEGDHHFAAANSDFGKISGRGWRLAQKKGGFFSYELQTKGASEALALVCAYGSRDMARSFEVEVDDQKIAAPTPDGTAPGEIFIARYELPAAVT